MKMLKNEEYKELQEIKDKFGECRAIEEKEGELYDVEISHHGEGVHGFGHTEEEAVKNAYKHTMEDTLVGAIVAICGLNLYIAYELVGYIS
jgi:hypothetical protein